MLANLYPDLLLDRWSAPEGFTPFFASERVMRSSLINITGEMPGGVETWFPNFGGEEPCCCACSSVGL